VKYFLEFDKEHRPCRCIVCVTTRQIRMLRDLDDKFDTATVLGPEPPKEPTIQ
jgi:hypothetical protein